MPTVETVSGPIEVSELGRIDAHEHIFLRTPVNPGDEFLDLAKAADELTTVAASGINTVIDLTPIGLGRQPREIAQVAVRSGAHIVAATGYHRSAHYRDNHWARFADDDLLLDVLLTDLTVGMDAHDWEFPKPEPTSHKAGIIKLGSSYQQITPLEQRWFTAGAAAAVLTGVPVAVHTEVGTAAHAVLSLLGSCGLEASRIMLAHTDRNLDLGLHLELIDRGAYLVYDTIGRIKYRPESALLDHIEKVATARGLDRICLGTDVGRKSTLLAYGGGPGMAVLGREFVPRLTERIGQYGVDTVLQTAPQAFLASVS